MGFFKDIKAQRALAAHGKGKTEEAMRLYQEAYAEGMNKARFLLPYSILLLRTGDYARAREVLKKVEKSPGGLSPQQRTQMLTNYAVACYKEGRLDYAIELLREVYRKGPNGILYGILGFLLVEKGNFEEALSFNQEAVAYDDEDPIVLDNLAQTYYRLGNDKQQALSWFEKAVQIKEDAIDTNYFLALYDIEEGRTEEARKRLRIASEGRFSPLNHATPEMIAEKLASLGK